MSLPLLHLYFVWALTLWDLQFFLSAKVAQPLVYIVHLGSPLLLVVMAIQASVILLNNDKWIWFPPMFGMFVISVLNFPTAYDKEIARIVVQYMLIYWVLAVATVVYVKTPRQAMPVLWIILGQFAWYAIWARQTGQVLWDPGLANFDGYGGLMVTGAGLCYWFGVGARSRMTRYFLFLLAGVCVMGVVASFARGAFLALVACVAWVWVRSPRKLATTGGIIGAAAVVVLAAVLIFDGQTFYAEIMSSFDEGTEEGTGAERWNLWKVGFKVWMNNPVFGVGGGNVGNWAVLNLSPDDLSDFANPNQLYGYNMHNAYVTVLSEFGAVGIFCFGWCIWDFFKRNKELRQPEAIQRWAMGGGGAFDLRYVSLGLEVSLVGAALGAMLYASLLSPAFYTLWAANRMIWAVTRPPRAPAAPPRRSGRHAV